MSVIVSKLMVACVLNSFWRLISFTDLYFSPFIAQIANFRWGMLHGPSVLGAFPALYSKSPNGLMLLDSWGLFSTLSVMKGTKSVSGNLRFNQITNSFSLEVVQRRWRIFGCHGSLRFNLHFRQPLGQSTEVCLQLMYFEGLSINRRAEAFAS